MKVPRRIRQDFTGGRDFAHPIAGGAAGFKHEHVAGGIHCDRGDVLKLRRPPGAVQRPLGASSEGRDRSVRGYFSNCVIARVGDEQIARVIEGDAVGLPKGGGCGWPVGEASGPGACEGRHGSVGLDFLNSEAVGRHVDVPGFIHGEPPDFDEPTCEGGDPAVPGDFANGVCITADGVAYVGVPGGAHGDGKGPAKARGGTGPVLIPRDADADQRGNRSRGGDATEQVAVAKQEGAAGFHDDGRRITQRGGGDGAVGFAEGAVSCDGGDVAVRPEFADPAAEGVDEVEVAVCVKGARVRLLEFCGGLGAVKVAGRAGSEEGCDHSCGGDSADQTVVPVKHDDVARGIQGEVRNTPELRCGTGAVGGA